MTKMSKMLLLFISLCAVFAMFAFAKPASAWPWEKDYEVKVKVYVNYGLAGVLACNSAKVTGINVTTNISQSWWDKARNQCWITFRAPKNKSGTVTVTGKVLFATRTGSVNFSTGNGNNFSANKIEKSIRLYP